MNERVSHHKRPSFVKTLQSWVEGQPSRSERVQIAVYRGWSLVCGCGSVFLHQEMGQPREFHHLHDGRLDIRYTETYMPCVQFLAELDE